MTRLRTVALELAPPDLDLGPDHAAEQARLVAQRCRSHGLSGRIAHVMVPDLVVEDTNRPVDVGKRMDVLDFWRAVKPELDGVAGLCSQVTVFLNEPQLDERLRRLRSDGMDAVVFVGKPHGVPTSEAPGPTPAQALSRFADRVPNRGVVLIPTRGDEVARFAEKCDGGATFALTQLLYSDRIVEFLRTFAERCEHRPEILLSFGFVPAVEERVRLIDWLLHDAGNEAVGREQDVVARVASLPAPQRRQALVDLYRRVMDGVRDLGFPLSVHLEAPYGVSDAACETFAQMLDYWTPEPEEPPRHG